MVRCMLTWQALDDIDQHTLVLGDDNKTRASLTRRLAVGKGSSVVIQLNAMEPKKVRRGNMGITRCRRVHVLVF